MTKAAITYILVSNDINGDQRMSRMASYLHESGHLVTILGRTKKSSIPLNPCHYTQHRLHTLWSRGPLFYFILNIRMIIYLMGKPIDHLVCVDIDTMLVGKVLRWFKKFNWVFDSHEWFTEVPELKDKPKVRALWGRISQWTIPYADRCITVNESLSKILGDKYHKDFDVLYNTPSLSQAEITPHIHHRKYILYQGAVNKGRGLECAILAMKMTPELDLLIVGDGDIVDDLKELITKNSLTERVHMIGWKSKNELAAYTKGAFIGLNLLDNESQSYYYSLANKFFDYMHSEIPAIHMDFPAYCNIIDKYKIGLTINHLNPELLAQTIQNLSEASQYQVCVSACQKAKRVYHWGAQADVIESVFG